MRFKHVAQSGQKLMRRALTTKVGTAEAAGLVHASASIGPSLESSLLPRTTIQQAGISGLVSAINYGLTATLQSTIQALGEKAVKNTDKSPRKVRVATMAADAAVFGASYGVQKLMSQRPQESIYRATARTAAFRVSMGSVAGMIAVVAEEATNVFVKAPGRVNAPLILTAGAAVGAGIHMGRSRRLLDTAAESNQYGQPIPAASVLEPLKAITVGVGISGGLYLLSRVETMAAAGIGHVVGKTIPGLAPISKAIGHGVTLGAIALSVERGIAFAYSSTEQAGNAIEPAYENRPESPYVSGGSNSKVDWDTIGREGRRFVNMALTADKISDVTHRDAMDPIRVFVGFDSAESPNARAYLAMEELEAMDAFKRPYIAVYSPTGSGYVNYVAAETAEYLTDGNIASVCVQYSVRPSFLSLDRIGTAWETNLALLTALAWKIRSMPEGDRPKILLFGESLGCQCAQDVFEKEGVQGFKMLDIHRALFVGTPHASKWRQHWLADPTAIDPTHRVVEIASKEEWDALDPDTQSDARVFLLTHDADPIPKFGPILAIQKPTWLGDPDTRPPGIPRDAQYWPIFTFLLVGIDLLNAEHVVPGKFESYGHDYRADIPEMIRTAWDLKTTDEIMERVEVALRKRELAWAERRLIAEAMNKAETNVRQKLSTWGVDHSVLPAVVKPQRNVEPDPYEASTPS